MKENMMNEDWEILTKCGDIEAVDGPSSKRQTIVHIRYHQQKEALVPFLKRILMWNDGGPQ